jgi:hypothetical protein
MGNFYDDAKYGVVTRKWFGLTKKLGGDCAAGYTFTGSGTTISHVARWYPMGPINVQKIGFMVLATLATTGNATRAVLTSKHQIKFYHGAAGARTTLIGTTHIQVGDASSTLHARQAQYSIASNESPTAANRTIAAGNTLTIYAATPTSDDGTAAAAVGTLSSLGTVAFFIDYIPSYDSNYDATQ